MSIFHESMTQDPDPEPPPTLVKWYPHSEIDYPEADDENARGAMEAERDALKARVADLERQLENAQRDIRYLNDKLDAAHREMNAEGNRVNWDGIPQTFADAMNAIRNQYGTGVLDIGAPGEQEAKP